MRKRVNEFRIFMLAMILIFLMISPAQVYALASAERDSKSYLDQLNSSDKEQLKTVLVVESTALMNFFDSYSGSVFWLDVFDKDLNVYQDRADVLISFLSKQKDIDATKMSQLKAIYLNLVELNEGVKEIRKINTPYQSYSKENYLLASPFFVKKATELVFALEYNVRGFNEILADYDSLLKKSEIDLKEEIASSDSIFEYSDSDALKLKQNIVEANFLLNLMGKSFDLSGFSSQEIKNMVKKEFSSLSKKEKESFNLKLTNFNIKKEDISIKVIQKLFDSYGLGEFNKVYFVTGTKNFRRNLALGLDWMFDNSELNKNVGTNSLSDSITGKVVATFSSSSNITTTAIAVLTKTTVPTKTVSTTSSVSTSSNVNSTTTTSTKTGTSNSTVTSKSNVNSKVSSEDEAMKRRGNIALGIGGAGIAIGVGQSYLFAGGAATASAATVAPAAVAPASLEAAAELITASGGDIIASMGGMEAASAPMIVAAPVASSSVPTAGLIGEGLSMSGGLSTTSVVSGGGVELSGMYAGTTAAAGVSGTTGAVGSGGIPVLLGETAATEAGAAAGAGAGGAGAGASTSGLASLGTVPIVLIVVVIIIIVSMIIYHNAENIRVESQRVDDNFKSYTQSPGKLFKALFINPVTRFPGKVNKLWKSETKKYGNSGAFEDILGNNKQ